MAVVKKSGHAVTSVLPQNSDASTVAPVNVKFPQAPGMQSGGKGGPSPAKASRGTLAGPNYNKG